MVTGGKGVGKSTTVRYLINSYLQESDKVILLDLDPGQAEMTYPGCVSLSIIEEPLLGPNFTHLKHPYYQQCLDEVNVSNCIPRYINYVKKLVDCLRSSKELSKYPIVVNTMGFCKGLGLDLCLLTIKFVQPTCVIQLESKIPKNNYDYKLTSDYVNEVKTLSICWNDASVSQVLQRNFKYHYFFVKSRAEGKRVFENSNMEPRQQRELNMLSYFSKIVDDRHNKSYCTLTSETINNIVPYEVPFDSVCVTLNQSVSPTHVLAAINGSVVALCGLDREQIKHTTGSSSYEQRYNSRSACEYPQYVVNATPSMCYGFGIVRGVDMEKRCLYINTPLNEAELQHVNLLLGCQKTPVPFLRALAVGGNADGPVPYMGPPSLLPTGREARRREGQFRVDLNASKKAAAHTHTHTPLIRVQHLHRSFVNGYFTRAAACSRAFARYLQLQLHVRVCAERSNEGIHRIQSDQRGKKKRRSGAFRGSHPLLLSFMLPLRVEVVVDRAVCILYSNTRKSRTRYSVSHNDIHALDCVYGWEYLRFMLLLLPPRIWYTSI
ncbi:unnamed protein product [Trichogramma brassicae]|uniref:Uncharacterized protein n=1 Tax=Trichogramma brassicae TaxID=86971 RepID=A0A6H5I6U4_9HYME|nr:unnamed protein product [Trichogramma brassicae]